MKTSVLKASELSNQLAAYRDVVAQKKNQLKNILAFFHCDGCQAPLEFTHQVDRQREFLVEECGCSACGATAPARRYRLQ